jgi:predicted nucleic acid-binding Zn ribbon protein
MSTTGAPQLSADTKMDPQNRAGSQQLGHCSEIVEENQRRKITNSWLMFTISRLTSVDMYETFCSNCATFLDSPRTERPVAQSVLITHGLRRCRRPLTFETEATVLQRSSPSRFGLPMPSPHY